MSENGQSLQCKATTEQGERCVLPAMSDSPYCLEHQEDAVAIADEVMITVTDSTASDQGVEEEIIAAVASSNSIAGKNGDLQLSDDELRAKIPRGDPPSLAAGRDPGIGADRDQASRKWSAANDA